ncbi:hypothetical protein SAMN05518847_10177 [Paenibacillus sp. OV219]|nr:hypothetical protein SAMN05518847_10177 [Paenibacillus sp. OV219]
MIVDGKLVQNGYTIFTKIDPFSGMILGICIKYNNGMKLKYRPKGDF